VHVVGLDIGGANIKAADNDQKVTTRHFEIWKAPQRLAEVLEEILRDFAPWDVLAVTMTAELADCFETKSDGVDGVLRAVEESSAGAQVFVWQTGAEFVSTDVAREIPLLVAAANWHALATWVGRIVTSSAALLIDIGSTTTDLIPLLAGVPVPQGFSDRERLQSGELVYSGVRRTPLCAIAHSVPFRDGYCPLAAEVFATTLDVYLCLGLIAEDSSDRDTANGRPATIGDAHDRLARSMCCDRTEIDADDATMMARFLADVQRQRIVGALDRVLKSLDQPCGEVIVSGSGGFLAEQIVREHTMLNGSTVVPLSAMFHARTSESACAMAVAQLGAERLAGLV
jgi:hypothetical protein